MKKIIKYLSILLLVLFVALSLIIFLMGNYLAFKYTIISVSILIFFMLLYWVRYSHFKPLKNVFSVITLVIVFYIGANLYVMTTGIYLDASKVIWMNGQVMTKSDKEEFTKMLNSLKTHHAHLRMKPAYSIAFTEAGDFDPRHLHVFRDKQLIYKGGLLGLESGLELDGYKLTEEVDRKLEELDKKYHRFLE